MGKLKFFQIPPFLNAMTAESIRSSPLDDKFYPFNTSIYVRATQMHYSKAFKGGSSVTSVLSLSNIKPMLSSQQKEVNKSIEVAVVGRSNCGKSSLINGLLGEKVAMPSKTPGKTQQLIAHTLNISNPCEISVVDAPGYGYAAAPLEEMNKWRDLTDKYFEHSARLMNTLVLIDSRRGIQDSDRILLDMLNEHKRFSTIVLTKADQLKPAELKDAMIKAANDARKFPRSFGTVFATSARSCYGIQELQMYLMFSFLNQMGAITKEELR